MTVGAPHTARDFLVGAVKSLYEAHPFPRYPLLARPRWRQAYLASSYFAARLAVDSGRPPGPVLEAPSVGTLSHTILVGGAGEILPYIISKQDPSSHHILSVDLSQASLRRARLRCLPRVRRLAFVNEDLDATLARLSPNSVAHVDLYGVLHHLATPSETLMHVSRALIPGGTVRVMVYNSNARTFIWHLQKMLAHFALNPADRHDVALGQELVLALAAAIPNLAVRLKPMTRVLNHPARFADGFLHPREARLSPRQWFAAFNAADLRPYALVDRYGELDDLPNPLWAVPGSEDIQDRANDGRFEHNLELFLSKPSPWKRTAHSARPDATVFAYAAGLPPSLWFSFEETATLGWRERLTLWRAHILYVRKGQARPQWHKRFSRPSLQRLARLGAILPGMVPTELHAGLLAPMEERMEAPTLPTPIAVPKRVCDRLTSVLAKRQRLNGRRLGAILERLRRAQVGRG